MQITLDLFIIFKVYLSLIEYIFLISYFTEFPMFESFSQIYSSIQ